MEVEAGSAAAAEAAEKETGAAAEARRRRRTRKYPASPPRGPEFPGCRTITLKCDEIATYEGRFEFWDAATETAWVVSESTSATHEYPSHRLSALCEVIASVRGSPITCLGAMDLERLGDDGARFRILQADQSVYLHPGRSRLPDTAGMVVAEHDFPDVVVEVDHTTDVRRGKLGLYEEWGFPEVWVEVPERDSPSRPAGRRPGLTIHRLEDGAYRAARESRAFPGWTANEVHLALDEPALSAFTSRVLDRVGRALGARDGTGPDDTPWLRAHRREAHARGRIEGRAAGRDEGRAQGLAEGRAEGRAEIMDALRRRLLSLRGISGLSDDDLLDALLKSEDEAAQRARPEPPRR